MAHPELFEILGSRSCAVEVELIIFSIELKKPVLPRLEILLNVLSVNYIVTLNLINLVSTQNPNFWPRSLPRSALVSFLSLLFALFTPSLALSAFLSTLLGR